MDDALKNHFSGSRFLFVIGQYGKLGGAERQALILADQLKNQYGCQVDFLAWGGDGRVTDELAARGIKAWVFPLEWNSSSWRKVLTLWQLARFIKLEIQPGYLLPYIGFNCKIIGLIWRRAGAKYTWWNQRDEGREVFGSRIEQYVIKSVPDIVSNSIEGQEFLVNKFNVQPGHIHIINNGIEIPKSLDRELWRIKLGLGDRDILITMVANLTKYKDHETLLKAFAILCTEESEGRLMLLLVGRLGETTQALKALAFDLGLSEKVHFAGEIRSVTDCYAASDLVVHSSANEGCPNAVLEAMAHGLAVCGTDISGIRQALGDDVGSTLLAPPGDHESLAGVMRKLISDEALRGTVGERNLKRIRDFYSPERLTAQVLQLILGFQQR